MLQYYADQSRQHALRHPGNAQASAEAFNWQQRLAAAQLAAAQAAANHALGAQASAAQAAASATYGYPQMPIPSTLFGAP